jgi:hypothetical protein
MSIIGAVIGVVPPIGRIGGVVITVGILMILDMAAGAVGRLCHLVAGPVDRVHQHGIAAGGNHSQKTGEGNDKE